MFRLFGKKRKTPLNEAITALEAALDNAYSYQQDRRYIPDAADLECFSRLERLLHHSHRRIERITRNMNQRANGKPEGPARFTDPDVFDYHYPP